MIKIIVIAVFALSTCKSRKDSDIKATACPPGWSEFKTKINWPKSIFGEAIPIGIVPGVVATFKTNSFGGYDTETVNKLKNSFQDEFFKRALPQKPTGNAAENLFFTAIAIDASAVYFFRESTLRSKAEIEMEEGYSQIPANKKQRFLAKNNDLEKYILVVDDSNPDANLHTSLSLPTFGAVLFDKNLCRSPNYNLPNDAEKLITAVKSGGIL